MSTLTNGRQRVFSVAFARWARLALLLALTMLTLDVTQGAAAETRCTEPVSICTTNADGAFALIRNAQPATVLFDPVDAGPVRRAATALRMDLNALAGVAPKRLPRRAIIVGSLSESPTIQKLLADGHISDNGIRGRWEAYGQTVVEGPVLGFDQVLVLYGADARGTAYAVYDLIERAGVSPWNWWADVPVVARPNLFVTNGTRSDAPAVRYRGIFLNDENPALLGWVTETYGGFNADFYERVFDLMLRLKANVIWPAMWGKAFHDDDPSNARMAEEFGVIIATSHHEPMMRAHVEWQRYGSGPWDYTQNAAALQAFWRRGLARRGGEETLVTVGMRGDGDEAMTEGTAISLLEQIVRDQRKIIAEVTGNPPESQPQVWALYKEVQDYFDKGMRVPEDVTLLFADDNWGNIRRLPNADDRDRAGGFGVYYHFDYVGGPRNYKWLNTTQIERVWEQMSMAYAHGVDRMWIVNVGDLKPMEFPIDFFLDMAWHADDYPIDRMNAFTEQWAAQQFGARHADESADLLRLYTKYNSRRKPELLDADTYPIDELEEVTTAYAALRSRADRLLEDIDPAYRDAYLQLVWWPIAACANLHELYYATAMSRLHAAQSRSDTSSWANRAADAFAADAALTDFYHTKIANGKWRHFASQTHIGYTSWQQPEFQTMPEQGTYAGPEEALPAIADANGTVDLRELVGALALAPKRAPDGSHYFELFNKGTVPFSFTLIASRKSPSAKGWQEHTGKDVRETVRIPIQLTAEAQQVKLQLSNAPALTLLLPAAVPAAVRPVGAHDPEDRIGIAASAAHCIIPSASTTWEVVPNLGHRGDGIRVRRAPYMTTPDEEARLVYAFTLREPGRIAIEVTTSPAFDVAGGDGIEFGVQIDAQPFQMHRMRLTPDSAEWNKAVSENQARHLSVWEIPNAGAHRLVIGRADAGLVFQRVSIGPDPLPRSYLGFPDSQSVSGTVTCPAGAVAD